MLNFRLVDAPVFVDINGIDGLAGIEETDDGGLRGGALTRHHTLETSGVVRDRFPVVHEAMKHVAHLAIRNRGTIGGSVAHADHAADWPVALLALGAEVTIARPDNQRHLPLANFLFAPFETALRSGELLSAVHIPVLSNSARWGYYKFCRKLGEFAETMAAVLFDPDRGISRAVIGATEARPTIIDAEFTNDTATAMIEENFSSTFLNFFLILLI